jgi:hypothetical protein
MSYSFIQQNQHTLALNIDHHDDADADADGDGEAVGSRQQVVICSAELFDTAPNKVYEQWRAFSVSPVTN